MTYMKKLLAIILAGLMVFAMAACAAEPTETEPTETEPRKESTAPTAEDTDTNEYMTNTVDPETYKEYIGIWYADGSSSSYRLNITDTSTWELTNVSNEVIISGSLQPNDENQVLELYDADSNHAISATIDAEGTLHIQIKLESLFDTLTVRSFHKEITNNIAGGSSVDMTEDSSHMDSDDSVPSLED